MKKTIIYIGNFSFPFGNAAGKRVYANGKCLSELGYNVIFIGMSKDVEKEASLKSTKSVFDGFEYYNYPYPKRNKDWVNYRININKFEKFISDTDVADDLACVIYYGSSSISLFNTRLIALCRKRDIKIVSDCVDWLTVKTNNIFFNIIKWCDNTFQKAYANKKADGVITISRYLQDYYKASGKKTVIVPPLSVMDKSVYSENGNERPVLVYAGMPFAKGRKIQDCNLLKDRIDKTIHMLSSAKDRGCVFTFKVFGLTKEEYLYYLPEQKEYIENLDGYAFFMGSRPNEEVVAEVIAADFTILIRDVTRDTTAGFPTKVSESIGCGTPVITTRTSDLADYLTDGETCIFLDFDMESAVDRLVEVLMSESRRVAEMKRKCTESNPFDHLLYLKKFKDFLDRI